MTWLYRRLARPVLFNNDAEEIHGRTLHGLASASHSELACDILATFFSAPKLPTHVFGCEFPNPVGLAAGMDKNAEAVPAWAALGFGFSELGGVTWHAQPGNPKPRIFRAVSEDAIVNRMGFNNEGAPALAETLRAWRAAGRWPNHPVGINLGKSKITPLETAAQDYANSFRALRELADFFVVNVSSPNTPNLRQLQDKSALDEIFAALREINSAPAPKSSGGAKPKPKPILVKVAPDLSFEALDEIVDLTLTRQISGIVATNTTIARPASQDAAVQKAYTETGGLSGRPLRSRSTEVIRHLFRQTRGKMPIIGVGGIFNANDAWEKILAGASLIQIYTGLVYEGPALPKAIVSGLCERLSANGFKRISDAVGKAA